MELTNEFKVGVPVDQAWAVLTDVERIAPCMPGAQLQEIDGDKYHGIVKVKVGPITAQYKGTASFIEQDATAHRAVLKAEGRDTRGQGNANALVTATLVAEGEGTAVSVVTDLTITGKVAQFGRGVLADVSGKLIDQFVANLERDVLSGDHAAGPVTPVAPMAAEGSEVAAGGANGSTATTTGDAPAGSDGASTGTGGVGAGGQPGPAPTSRRIHAPDPEPVDLLATAGSPVAKRVVPLLGGLLLVLLAWRLLRRRP